jgi:hypothetical protein
VIACPAPRLEADIHARDRLRASKRMPAGFLTVLLGMLYAPVRFFLEYLRPSTTDPRYLSLTTIARPSREVP